MAYNFQKVLSGRRIAIPPELSNRFNIKEGDIVIVEANDDPRQGIRILPAEVTPRNIEA